jgi:sugar transferase (PEP-CTERM/EpsH1 system associated)
MRILWLTSYAPWPPDFGGARRTYHLIEQAARAGHAIHLLAFGDADPARQAAARAALGRICVAVDLIVDPAALPAAIGDGDPAAVARKRRGQLRSLLSLRPYQYYAHQSAAMQARLDALAREPWDLVQVEFSQMAYYRLPAGVPAVLDLHNVEYEVLVRAAEARGVGAVRRLYNQAEAVKFRRDEPRLWRRFTALLTTSERDRQQVLAHAPGLDVTVVPNGVDTAYFHPAPPDYTSSDAAPTVVFTGMMAYYPNQDGVLYFAEQIWPLVRQAIPAARLLVVGTEPPPVIRALDDGARGITVTGAVPDVRPYVWDAAVCVVPLRIGGGTRLKIVEALAMEKAIVSTSVGCEGIDVTPGRTLDVADTPAAFAAATVALLRDPARRAVLGRAGRALALDRYDWNAAARPMLDCWGGLTRSADSAPVLTGAAHA